MAIIDSYRLLSMLISIPSLSLNRLFAAEFKSTSWYVSLERRLAISELPFGFQTFEVLFGENKIELENGQKMDLKATNY